MVLASLDGKMIMHVISVADEFERDLLLERKHAGIAHAKASGKRFNRPPALDNEKKKLVLLRLNK